MTREEKIAAIVNGIDDWDLDTVVQYAKDRMEDFLVEVNDEELNREYQEPFGRGQVSTCTAIVQRLRMAKAR